MVGWILSIFGIQGFVHPRSLPAESEHSSFKNGHPSDGSQNIKLSCCLRMTNDLNVSVNITVYVVSSEK
jgi:hypothetical protein